MGQKVNPIAVRLNFNRLSESSWFSDYYYSTLLYQDLNIRQYLSSIKQPNANKLGFRTAKCIIHHFPKRSLFHLFCLSDPRKNDPIVPKNQLISTKAVDCRRQYFWYKCSILQKKKALVNLHRGIAASLTGVCSSGLLFFGCQSHQRHMLRQGWLKSLSGKPHFFSMNGQGQPSIAFGNRMHRNVNAFYMFADKRKSVPLVTVSRQSGTQIVHGKKFMPNSMPFVRSAGSSSDSSATSLVGTQKGHARMDGESFNSKTSIDALQKIASPQKTFAFFNFLAMHFYFMQKTNNFFLIENQHLYSHDHPQVGSLLLKRQLEYNAAECKQIQLHRPKNEAAQPNETSNEASNNACISFNHTVLNDSCPKQSTQTNPTNNIISDELKVSASASFGSKLPLKSKTLMANTIWPSILNIQTNPRREVWQLLFSFHATETRSFESKAPLGQLDCLLMEKKVNKGSLYKTRKQSIETAIGNEGSLLQRSVTKSLDYYLSHVNFMLSQNTNTFTQLKPIKVPTIFQCAFLVAQEVACKLEQKKSFRLICRSIFQQLSVCNYVKGIRIACSGRLNGSDIAKTECRKFGETSLHVFSDKIDYARTRASTPYGILGVKVWISYI